MSCILVFSYYAFPDDTTLEIVVNKIKLIWKLYYVTLCDITLICTFSAKYLVTENLKLMKCSGVDLGLVQERQAFCINFCELNFMHQLLKSRYNTCRVTRRSEL